MQPVKPHLIDHLANACGPAQMWLDSKSQQPQKPAWANDDGSCSPESIQRAAFSGPHSSLIKPQAALEALRIEVDRKEPSPIVQPFRFLLWHGSLVKAEGAKIILGAPSPVAKEVCI